MRQLLRGARRLAAVALSVAAASSVGVTVLLGVATVTSRPVVFCSAGLVAAAATAVVGAWVLTRGTSVRVRQPHLGVVLVAAAVAPLALALVPGGIGPPAAPVQGEQYWQLPDGDRLRYVKVRGTGGVRRESVVFLHGGPGTPDLAGDSRYFGQLAGDGFDVYVYDQVGAGGSTRLDHPADYSLARDVTDLELIRRRIGAAHMALIGHSYGANVAAAYLAAHPGRVTRAVLSSPAPLDPADRSGGNLVSRLDTGQRAGLYSRLLQPRNLLVYALLQLDPESARALAGDPEMDARNDVVYAASEPSLHCPGQADPHPLTGTGFYRLQYPQSVHAPPAPDLRAQLTGDLTPALVIKGECDYQSWSSAIDYLTALPNSRLLYLHGGGHNAYQDVPAGFLKNVRDFLTSPPSRRSAPPSPPHGYQGPP